MHTLDTLPSTYCPISGGRQLRGLVQKHATYCRLPQHHGRGRCWQHGTDRSTLPCLRSTL